MELDLTAVRSFLVLARTRHFTVAARELRISPAGLTKRVQRLERQLGTALVKRDQGGVSGLTPQGALLAASAPTLLGLADTVRTAVRSANPETLRIGVEGFGRSPELDARVRAATKALRVLYPRASVSMWELGYVQPVVALRAGVCDLAFTPWPASDPSLASARLWSLDRIGVVSKHHPLARRDSVDVERFASEPMLHSHLLEPKFMSLWVLGDVRPLADARIEQITPREFNDVIRRLEAGREVLALQAGALHQLPSNLRPLELSGVPEAWYHLIWQRSLHSTLARMFLQVLTVELMKSLE
ncbi:LysR family transcriptional regulator [Streptomyces sp. MBT65]|uniref:LysR family transcriptional regulator n=1 Tax=Streptomyces sp. MBT65 TaxID=1488395 RepID=UPI00190B276A|nr:LysR family transcriptional regulator [Streptomyces sp. MBT65]MBK3576897.1 LysR family transcriptional regulator [Streptomyces sp. MBT65]